MVDRLSGVQWILDHLQPAPEGWVGEPSGKKSKGGKSQSQEMALKPCSSYKDLIGAWRKAMRWTEGLDAGLATMLASITSTESVGDQLWIKVIGPASSGKSTLCEAVSTASRYVLAKSTIRGFHSGWKGEDGEDHSLIAQVRGKTLVTKDGDTLLQSPNLGQILSEARDLYDSTSRSHYRNSTASDYTGVRMTWLLCGTASLRQIDASELGERFLDCVVMEGIDDDLEDEILWRVANRAERNLSIRANGRAETQYEPEMAVAMAMTGGYVEYLRENAQEILSGIDTPEWALRRCTRLGKFVAYMRARPSRTQDEDTEREFAARLVSQHIRLMKCLAAVLNKGQVDLDVMRKVTKVALDTARGVSLKIARKLYGSEDGFTVSAVGASVGYGEDKVRNMLRFLGKIGITTVNREPAKSGAKTNQTRYILTPRLTKLWREVHGA